MSFKPKTPAAEETHYGFTNDGSCFLSPEPVDNLPTRAVRDLVRKIQQGHLRPDETVLEISHQPDAVKRLFPNHILAQWSTFGNYWQWPLAWVGNSAQAALKHAGAGVPTRWQEDKPWLDKLAHARRIHHEETPPQEIEAATATLAAFLSR